MFVFAFLLNLLEVNSNFVYHHFCGMEYFRTMLEFKMLKYMDLKNNPYLRQDNLTSEEIKRKRNKHNYVHMIIKLPRRVGSMTTDYSGQNKNISLTNTSS